MQATEELPDNALLVGMLRTPMMPAINNHASALNLGTAATVAIEMLSASADDVERNAPDSDEPGEGDAQQEGEAEDGDTQLVGGLQSSLRSRLHALTQGPIPMDEREATVKLVALLRALEQFEVKVTDRDFHTGWTDDNLSKWNKVWTSELKKAEALDEKVAPSAHLREVLPALLEYRREYTQPLRRNETPIWQDLCNADGRRMPV